MRMITVIILELKDDLDIRVFETGNGSGETKAEQGASQMILKDLNIAAEKLVQDGIFRHGDQHGNQAAFRPFKHRQEGDENHGSN